MGRLSSWLFGLGLGAGLMYFMDPQQGDRRKAMVRDQVYRLQNRGDEAIETAMRDLRNRARGVLSKGMALVSDEDVPGYILEERVRSRLGFLTRHPGAIQVTAEGQNVILSGDILADEVDQVVAGVQRIRGVKSVQNKLNVHQEPGNIPQLQGEGWLPGDTRGAMQWSPTARLLAGMGAGYLLLYSFFRGGLVGLLARVGGIILGVRALTNQDLRTMTGQKSEFQAVRLRKSINIQAPVDEVYHLWSNFKNFPKFMSNIEEIRDLGDNRSHWVVKGPAGSKVEFEAVMTENIPNEKVAWETTPESQVQHTGQVRFKESQRGTQVSINMAYTPPAGVAGHAVAKLFGKDPKSEMDADLARMKSLLEEGKTTAGNKEVTRDRVMPVTGESRSRRDQEEMMGSGTMAGDFTGDERLEDEMMTGDDETIDDEERRNMGGMGDDL